MNLIMPREEGFLADRSVHDYPIGGLEVLLLDQKVLLVVLNSRNLPRSLWIIQWLR